VNETVIYPARRIITMNPGLPFAEAVAVRGDRILGIGDLAELQTWGPHTVDETFVDHVITPGFVEAHSHNMTGGMWANTYLGFFDRRAPDGKIWAGCKTIEAIQERLREAEMDMDDPSETLVGWGLDPIYLRGERLVGRHLDAVSETRPIFIQHASGHLATVNSEMLRREEITEHNPTPGIQLGEDGKPNGELQEPAAMRLATSGFRKMRLDISSPDTKWGYAFEARNAGHTTITDLGGSLFTDDGLDEWRQVTDDPEYPARVMVAGSTFSGPMDLHELAQRAVERRDNPSNDKLKFGIIKLMLDGSIQGFTARLTWPYYHNPPEGNAKNGIWVMAPETMPDTLEIFHKAGLTVHCHCNGDEASEVFISAVEEVLERHPRWDHRHTVQHCQLTTPSQYARMAALGMHANIFSNHIFYWGDEHADFTVGPERAARMDACGTAEQLGVPFSFHSDAPVTPMGHLHVMWCAVNRQTSTGKTLGPDECISVETAMKGATIEAARQLKLDHEIGSIQSGKYADFAILEEDPYKVDPMKLKNIGVWGTVLGGKKFPAATGG
jgi:predicted amidohydrolase YtcJ